MAYLVDSPGVVLQRVKAYEDMELPSLPSVEHDIDYDSSNAESSRDDQVSTSYNDITRESMATPHPLRKVMMPAQSGNTSVASDRSAADSFSTASESPFPPISLTQREETPSPYTPGAALTSTPLSRYSRSSLGPSQLGSTVDQTTSTSRQFRHDRTKSGSSSLGGSTHASRRERWQTPGEMSGSFSGEEIVYGSEGLGTEKSVPLNDHSGYENSYSQSLPELPSMNDAPEETPVTRRLSSANVIMDRPRRRSTFAAGRIIDEAAESDVSMPSTPRLADSQSSATTALHLPKDRIPSLTRSEVSNTDTSGPATTPEGPVRSVSMITPRYNAHQDYEVTGEFSYAGEGQTEDGQGDSPTLDYQQEYEYTSQEGTDRTQSDFASPAKSPLPRSAKKQPVTPGYDRYLTPGTARGHYLQEQTFENSGEQPSAVLHDVTNSVSNTPSSAPFTPTPLGYATKAGDLTTPRAPLNDAERRKSHVLAVLSSSDRPTRPSRPPVRGTPHPLRRVSLAPDAESISEEGSIAADTSRPLRLAATPGSLSRLTADQSGNESFVSIASSADLTSDRRASHLHSKLSRGNTSFPTLLLPSTPGSGSLKGMSDHRADGIKIHKHLNAMNKQLLETNADLAREAEAWRDEVDRLRGILQDNGIEVEDVDVMAGLNITQTGSVNLSQQLPEWTASPGGRSNETSDHSKLIAQLASPNAKDSTSTQDLLAGVSSEEYAAVMQEMAERLETLEESLHEKDQVISDLEKQLASLEESGDNGSAGQQAEIHKLVARLEEAERARNTLHTDFAQKTEQHARRFGEICSGFEEQVKGLERDLGTARSEADRLRADKIRLESMSTATTDNEREIELKKQVQDLQIEVDLASEASKKRAAEVDGLKSHAVEQLQEKEGLMQRVQEAEAEIEQLQQRVLELEAQVEENNKEIVAALKAQIVTVTETRNAAEKDVQQLSEESEVLRATITEREAELDTRQATIEQLSQAVADLEADLVAAQESSRANEQAEEELRAVQDQLQGVNDKLSEKESEVEMLKGKLEVASIATDALRTSQRRSSTTTTPVRAPSPKTPGQDSFMNAMEERLDEAYREIGRLKHELGATPSRKSAVEVRDARIQALEREKAALAERLASARSSAPLSTPKAAMQEAGSPFKRITPFVNRTIASLKTPGPMAELSWLQSSIGDANEPVLQAQLEYLQHELKDANEQLDSNFSRLEAAGLGSIALAEKLAAAEERIGELEDEIRTLVQRNKASLALVSAEKEERERATEGRMQKALEAVHAEMEQLKSDIAAERHRLQRDNGRLNDLVSEMKLRSQKEVESFRAEMTRMNETAEEDMNAVRAEMSKLTSDKEKLQKEIQQSHSRVAQLELELADEKRAYDSLSRRSAQAAQVAVSPAELTRKIETISSLEAALRDAQMEIDNLQDQLSTRTRSLNESEQRLAELKQERENVARELEDFERDLSQQKAEAREFGEQLQMLKRGQSSTSDRHQTELQALQRELRDARELERRTARELSSVQSRYEEAERMRSSHVCDTSDAQALVDQKAHFKAQSRELASQIRYLKAKFTRESTFRNALSLQKRYLLLLVGGMSLDYQATLKAIAQMGFPVPEPQRPRKSFKSVALAVLGTIRARNMAKEWKAEVQLKQQAVVAHSERRRVSART
ncbi:hypothetical protein IAU60_006226 [Kwoniella sp. DSM 27419]